MFDKIFGGGCGRKPMPQMRSCDIMWIILLLFIVLNGGLFGLDICTLVILGVIFGSHFLCKPKKEHCSH